MLKTNGLKRALYMSVLLVFIQSGFIQAQPCDPGGGLGGTGTDVIIGDLVGTSNYGAAGGFHAYSVGTTSCNIGTEPLLWIPSTNEHPVIGQNLFRLHDGRFEQIGMSWLKHGFLALQQNICGCGCVNPGTGTLLGVGCSDPYSSGLNGQQGGLGPRSEVFDVANGLFQYPIITSGLIADTTSKRLRVATNDIDPAAFPGATFIVEGQYVTVDDSSAGNANNNCSYRTVSFGATGNRNMSLLGTTQRQQPAIQAWQDLDPQVTLTEVIDADNGLVIVGYRVTELGGGQFAYEYAIYNMNSTRSVRSFEFPLAGGVTLNGLGATHPIYHSGEPYSNAAWVANQGAGTLSWSTETEAQNVNANAIRWSTMHSFRFVANAPATTVTATLDHFTGGGSATVEILAPSGDFTLPVTAATCVQNGEQVDLSWSNGEIYDSIEVTRDGVSLATLAGSATNWTDVNALPGDHTYGLNATVGVVPSGIVPCNILVQAALAISVPNGDPLEFNPLGGETFAVTISPLTGSTVAAGTENLRVVVDGLLNETIALNFVSGQNYEMVFPPTPCGETVQWWIEAQSTGGQQVSYPEGGASAAVQGISAFGSTSELTDFEAASGWSLGAPATATTGIWVRGVPIGTAAQPGEDHSPSGTNCWFTGQGSVGGSLGENDVDGGETALYSPVMDLTTSSNPVISYWRWYSNNSGASPGADIMSIQISDDLANWTNIEVLGPTGPNASGGWIQHSFNVSDFALLTSNVQVRFIVGDLGAGSIVEAAIDDFSYEDVDCSGVADCNGNGVIDADDIANGTSLDCDLDNIPDECSTANGSVADCNANGLPDLCELASGAADCDFDGNLDACELDTDLDGTIDDCDDDIDGDGILNACDTDQTAGLDCDINGQLDSCDLAAGAADCDFNGQLDSCQISSNPAVDCNLNGALDVCDLAGGVEQDCDGNSTPDSCQISADPTQDCDVSGTLDSCDLASGSAFDCNTNGVLDSCDISSGTSTDNDSNGEPDECAVQEWVRGDINGDGAHDISDAVASLDYLFSSGAPGCVASVDVNDDDATNIADTVSLLSYLFAGGAQPPAPFPACGVDPNGSALSCDAFPQCP